MILDRKHFSLLVQAIDKSHPNAAGGYVEGRVLDNLDFLNYIRDGEMLGNKMGTAYMKRDRISDL